ncbi:amino acid ABC transporter substrate-binding protein [Microbacterium terricola]|uniref:Amino acid ABC transporter substrate-binding protein n=1 Tax=Microbacterium terricola TaxID=344163 RepID=A0ABM8DYV8_9MICO|nr:amino acid ABC transporter substrate-binding protein [Microbacterium terricola]UYK41508.1 amino acid ABC transporter substrate-binding protein [Microbacterium terricola]BDV30700.1 amino acid ABC transporter substrate-binding protein [Microbacterium terricola]
MSRRAALRVSAIALASVFALSGCSSTAAPESSAADAGYDLVASGTLTVATEGTYRPFSYHEDGTGPLVGYDVEIAEAVAEKLGLEVSFQETQWDAIFAGLEGGRFDVIANQVSITPDREETYAFSAPYAVSPGVIVTKESDDSIASFDDLAGKTTAQSLTSNWYELAQDSGAKVEAVEGWAQAVTLLDQGRVDATINDKLTFLDYQTTNPGSGLKIAAETEDSSQSAFALVKANGELADAITAALEELRTEGVLAELGEKYFGADVSQ